MLRELLRGLKYATTAHGDELEPDLQPQPQPIEREPAFLPKRPFKVSSRNVLEGKIKRMIKGSVNTEVTLEIVHAVELTSIITTTSAETLALAEDKTAYAVIKSSDVVIGIE